MKILVIDSQGGDGISPRYRELMPNVGLRGVEMAGTAGTNCHPHGLMAGYYAGCLFQSSAFDPSGAEIVFVRVFDRQARTVADSDKWMLDVIARENPDIVTRSWGGIYGNGRQGDITGQVMWGEWVEEYRKLQAEIGFVDFGSAGNSGDWRKDDDTVYPQKMMPEICNIIGSARRDGIPSEWSSDGAGVQCVAWGERIYLCDNGKWELGSGTSFSCPKMAGLCAVLRFDTAQWRKFVQAEATRPHGFDHSWKWGHGNMEDQFQFLLQKVPAALQPPSGPLRMHMFQTRERWFDYHLVI